MIYNKVVVELVSVSVQSWRVYGMLLHHVKETFDRNVCRPATKVRSMDLWIGISVSFVKIKKTGLCSGLWGKGVQI